MSNFIPFQTSDFEIRHCILLINNNFRFAKYLFEAMEQTLISLESQKNWKEFIKKSCRKNKISI